MRIYVPDSLSILSRCFCDHVAAVARRLQYIDPLLYTGWKDRDQESEQTVGHFATSRRPSAAEFL